jgi:hypothetical protein
MEKGLSAAHGARLEESMDADDSRVLALAVIAHAVKDAKNGNADALAFLMEPNDDLTFWTETAGLETDTLWQALAKRLAARKEHHDKTI